MPISFQCPHCKTIYDVADDLAGKFIMCRGCQKRGQVRNASAPSASAAVMAAAAAASPTRRKFLAIAGWSAAAIGAITTGAVLARRPWLGRRRRADDRGSRGPRGPRGPQDQDKAKEKQDQDKSKEKKEGT